MPHDPAPRGAASPSTPRHRGIALATLATCLAGVMAGAFAQPAPKAAQATRQGKLLLTSGVSSVGIVRLWKGRLSPSAYKTCGKWQPITTCMLKNVKL